MYEDLPLWAGDVPPRNVTLELAFGPCFNGTNAFDTEQLTAPLIFIYRLLRSRHCPLTRDPAAADLFFIPAMSSVKGSAGWPRACSSPIVLDASTAPRYLPHLNEATAHRHFAIIGNGAIYVAKGAACGWLRGEGGPLFQRIQKYSYTSTFTGRSYSAKKGEEGEGGGVALDGRVLSIPVPSGIHWSSAAPHDKPWAVHPSQGGQGAGPAAHAQQRPLRAFFIGKMHGQQEGLRKKLFGLCNDMGPPHCRAVTAFGAAEMVQKQRAVFCLEPEGDSPWRKSIYDSITSGCIPVFFSGNTDALSPLHWPPAVRASSRLVIPERAFLSGKTQLKALKYFPAERIAEMQRAIGAHAHRLHYALDDYPSGDDAFEVLLKKAHLRAQGVPWDSPELAAL
jgi:hypothetical protein